MKADDHDGIVTMKAKPKKLLLGGLLLLEVVSAQLAWRDLSWRADDQVRGSKKTWRVFMILNPGNSLAYWAFGRKAALGATPAASRPTGGERSAQRS